MKSRSNDAAIEYFNNSGCFQRPPRHRGAVLHHLPAVFAVTVNHAGGRDAARILSLRVQLDAIHFLWQVLAHHRDANDVRESPAHHAMMLGSPGNGMAGESTPGLVQRAETPL